MPGEIGCKEHAATKTSLWLLRLPVVCMEDANCGQTLC